MQAARSGLQTLLSVSEAIASVRACRRTHAELLTIPRSLHGGLAGASVELIVSSGNLSLRDERSANVLPELWPQQSRPFSAESCCRSSAAASTSQPVQRTVHRQLAWRRASCTCAAAGELQKPTVPAQPGTVSPYSHHVLLRIPPPSGEHSTSPRDIWWPPVLEKHPAMVQVFKAVAAAPGSTSDGVVKVTAFEDVGTRGGGDAAVVDAMIFPAGVLYRGLPVERIREIILRHVSDAEGDATVEMGLQKAAQETVEGLALFVCTHGSRDARCGSMGRQVAEKLETLVRQRGLDAVRVYQASHLGGHKYAGNVLVYGSVSPCDGDWFGGISPEDAEDFLDALLNAQISEDGGLEDRRLRRWWRGRMGLTKEEQVEAFERAPGIPSAPLPPPMSDAGPDGGESPPPPPGGPSPDSSSSGSDSGAESPSSSDGSSSDGGPDDLR